MNGRAATRRHAPIVTNPGRSRVRLFFYAKAVAGGLALLVGFYLLVLGVHVLELAYPCRAVDPKTGASRAVSCLYEDTR